MADSTISIRITASGDAGSPSAPSAPAVNPRRPDAATAGAAERAASAAAASATRETAGVVAGAQKSLAGALASFVAGQGLAMGLSAYTSAVTAVNPERRQSMAYLSAIGGGAIAGGATGAGRRAQGEPGRGAGGRREGARGLRRGAEHAEAQRGLYGLDLFFLEDGQPGYRRCDADAGARGGGGGGVPKSRGGGRGLFQDVRRGPEA